MTEHHITLLPHASIAPCKLNPRTHFDAQKLADLKQSLTEHGFNSALSHLLVRPGAAGDGEARYELVCGERRWRAAGELIAEGKLAAEVPAVIEEMSDGRVLELQLVENLQRDDLTPLEEAEGYRQMLDLHDEAGDPLHTRASIAAKIGRTEQHIKHRLDVAKLRGTTAGDALEAGELTLTHARLGG